MPQNRPAIPEPLKRQVKDDAGWRCSIPACRSSDAIDVAHITPWSKDREHKFENLIALCANDHRRYDAGEIPEISMRQYKANQLVVNQRYGTIERRVIQWFADRGLHSRVFLPHDSELQILYLLRDGLLVEDGTYQHHAFGVTGFESVEIHLNHAYVLTSAGHQFVEALLAARPIA